MGLENENVFSEGKTMFEVALILIASLAGLVMILTLGFMALMPFLKKKEDGPWVVVKGDEFLIFHGPANWSTTSIPEHADKFGKRDEAENWARYIGGKVIPISEIL